MIFISISLSGIIRTRHYHVRGYLDLEEESHNIVFANYYLFGKFKIYQKVVFKEKIPQFAMLKKATLGFYDWKSSRPAIIDAAIAKRTIKKIMI